MSFCKYVHMYFPEICEIVYLSTFLATYLSIYPYIHPSIHPAIYLSTNPQLLLTCALQKVVVQQPQLHLAPGNSYAEASETVPGACSNPSSATI